MKHPQQQQQRRGTGGRWRPTGTCDSHDVGLLLLLWVVTVDLEVFDVRDLRQRGAMGKGGGRLTALLGRQWCTPARPHTAGAAALTFMSVDRDRTPWGGEAGRGNAPEHRAGGVRRGYAGTQKRGGAAARVAPSRRTAQMVEIREIRGLFPHVDVNSLSSGILLNCLL